MGHLQCDRYTARFSVNKKGFKKKKSPQPLGIYHLVNPTAVLGSIATAEIADLEAGR